MGENATMGHEAISEDIVAVPPQPEMTADAAVLPGSDDPRPAPAPLSSYLPKRAVAGSPAGLNLVTRWRREHPTDRALSAPQGAAPIAQPGTVIALAAPHPDDLPDDLPAPPAISTPAPLDGDEDWARYASEMSTLERRLHPLLTRGTPVTLGISGCSETIGGTALAHALAHHLAGVKKRVLLCADTTRHRRRRDADRTGGDEGGIDLIRLPNLRIVNVAHLHRAQFNGAAAHAFNDWIAALRDKFDVIILDMPPLLDHQPWARLLPMLDGVILVVQAAATHTAHIRRTLDLIEESGGRALGFVFNRARRLAPKAFSEWLDETRPMRGADTDTASTDTASTDTAGTAPPALSSPPRPAIRPARESHAVAVA